MKVEELIEELKKYDADMEVVSVGDYIRNPNLSVEAYTNGFDENGNVKVNYRLEIS